ncbi:uncharacterized protein LOC115921543 [Strongylocentrotus purpuratus]|uniref:Uncharacterized protein n=1 Tax=Strongylocentrotus purpuratus TaxID=7668 RepID=A0A7M7NH40_STRPU|nr:uncharacterized protein LOC115921543 [Strongylocentrotus purpuratus]
MLECFHNHILMYASKRYSFDYPANRARNLLAVIDYMAHKDRPDQIDEQGNTKYVAVWSKRANNYVARKEKVPKTYPYMYVQGLIVGYWNAENRTKDHCSRRLFCSLMTLDTQGPGLHHFLHHKLM